LRLGKLPSESCPERIWRTRADPFAEVRAEEEQILKDSPTAEGKTVFEYLCRKYEGRFQEGQLRTLQRRVKRWRAHRRFKR
ncbi:MAG: IS21 family transposase, partial [Acidobacteriota bacterium]